MEYHTEKMEYHQLRHLFKLPLNELYSVYVQLINSMTTELITRIGAEKSLPFNEMNTANNYIQEKLAWLLYHCPNYTKRIPMEFESFKLRLKQDSKLREYKQINFHCIQLENEDLHNQMNPANGLNWIDPHEIIELWRKLQIEFSFALRIGQNKRIKRSVRRQDRIVDGQLEKLDMLLTHFGYHKNDTNWKFNYRYINVQLKALKKISEEINECHLYDIYSDSDPEIEIEIFL